MEEEENQEGYLIWVDWARQIVSFHEVEGFQQLSYPTHEEMLDFAIAKGYAGFGIQ